MAECQAAAGLVMTILWPQPSHSNQTNPSLLDSYHSPLPQAGQCTSFTQSLWLVTCGMGGFLNMAGRPGEARAARRGNRVFRGRAARSNRPPGGSNATRVFPGGSNGATQLFVAGDSLDHCAERVAFLLVNAVKLLLFRVSPATGLLRFAGIEGVVGHLVQLADLIL